MFTGPIHRRNPDSGGSPVRECPGDSELRLAGTGRSRSRNRIPTGRCLPGSRERQFVQGNNQQLFRSGDAGHPPGLRRPRKRGRWTIQDQRYHLSINLSRLLLLLASGLNCSCHGSPEATFQNAQQALQRGNLIRCLSEADQGYREFGSSSPEWGWKFKILKAEVLTLSGKSEDALALFASAHGSPSDPDSKVEMMATVGVALAHLHSFPDADRDLAQADGLC